jgi:hypothetical protein
MLLIYLIIEVLGKIFMLASLHNIQELLDNIKIIIISKMLLLGWSEAQLWVSIQNLLLKEKSNNITKQCLQRILEIPTTQAQEVSLQVNYQWFWGEEIAVILGFTLDSSNNNSNLIVIITTTKVGIRFFLDLMDLIILSNNQHSSIQDITIKPKKL